jgi:hypothetical protein
MTLRTSKLTFPFLLDGREKGQGTVFEKYPTEMLSHSSILAIETHLSSYTIPGDPKSYRLHYGLARRFMSSPALPFGNIESFLY